MLYRPTTRYLLYRLEQSDDHLLVPVDLYNFSTSGTAFVNAVHHTRFLFESLHPDFSATYVGLLQGPKVHYDNRHTALQPFTILQSTVIDKLVDNGNYNKSTVSLTTDVTPLPQALLQFTELSADWVAIKNMDTNSPTTLSQQFASTIKNMVETNNHLVYIDPGDFTYNCAIEYHLRHKSLPAFNKAHHKKGATIRKFVNRNYHGATFKPSAPIANRSAQDVIPLHLLNDPTPAVIDRCRTQLEALMGSANTTLHKEI